MFFILITFSFINRSVFTSLIANKTSIKSVSTIRIAIDLFTLIIFRIIYKARNCISKSVDAHKCLKISVNDLT